MPTLADHPELFKTEDPETPPSHVIIYTFVENTFVVLAQVPTPICSPKKRPAFFPHRTGRIPQLEAIALARALLHKPPVVKA